MDLPPLNRLAPHALRPSAPAPIDAPAYEGQPWSLVFEEQTLTRGPVGPRVCISIQLRNQARGHADATDGSQMKLMDALTKKFVPIFSADTNTKWQLQSKAWKILCSDKTQSFAEWKFVTDVGMRSAKAEGRSSWIPGGATGEFLKLAFEATVGALPVELAGREYTWKQDPNQPSQEGARVVGLLAPAEGLESVLGGGRRLLKGRPT
jgi:hypothetical protein